jgi:3-deoxy-D-manno-octulosonic-acid transferase
MKARRRKNLVIFLPLFVLYQLAYLVGLGFLTLSLPFWRLVLGQRLGWRERFGLPAAWRRPAGGLIHVHAASIGEMKAVLPLCREIKRRRPELSLVLTTTTTSARNLAVQQDIFATTRLAPYDLSFLVDKFFDRLRPDLILVVETEIWPSFLVTATSRQLPCLIANGRISDKSYPLYHAVAPLVASVLDGVVIMARSEEDAERFRGIGVAAKMVAVIGDLKAEALGNADFQAGRQLLRELGLSGKILVAGSLHRGEEQELLEMYSRLRQDIGGLRLVLAPRDLGNLGMLERRIRQSGLTSRRRSEAQTTGEIVILDTHGELAGIYGGAWLAFVGGSLVKKGGQNVLEAAAAGCPCLFGPNTGNFRWATQALLESGGGYRVNDAADLVDRVKAMADDEELWARSGKAAAQVVQSHKGALARSVAMIEAALDRRQQGDN